MASWVYEKPDNLVDWWIESEKKFSDNVLFWVHDSEGGIAPLSYGEIGKRINNARGGLAKLGIGKDDAVGIIAPNRPEWAVLAYATYGRNARFIPMYEKELTQTWKYIIADSAVKFLMVSSQDIYDEVKGFCDEIETLEKIFIIDSDSEISMAALEKIGEEAPVEPLIPVFDDVAVLIYTSGTTAEPKGVLLTHGNLTYCSRAGYRLYPDLVESQVGISMLPWAHSYALSAELNNWIQFGGSLGFMRDVTTLAEDLKIIRPTYLISVPRVFNKIYDGIQLKMSDAGGLKKKLFDLACATAREKRELAEEGRTNGFLNFKQKLLDKIVFSKVREAMGGRVTGALTASAAMNKEIAEFYYDIGIPIYDCYGLTETSPAVTMNSPNDWRIGSVGKVLDGQKVVIDRTVSEEGAEDGEIIVYGPNIMKGYHNKPEETAAVIMADGGFRTGDRGRFDEDGFLWITGRIKEQYKLTNGKYVFPAVIEEEVKLMPYVANAMVYGDGKPYNICLILPDFEVTARWAAIENVSADPDDLLSNEKFRDMMTEEIKAHLRNTFGGYEIPEKFLFLREDFTIENRMLTQTMKLKRRNVIDTYADDIEKLYS
ncbi:MAG: long-chain fatty acid--CoA ligase [Firmicutes bacterium]|nr:long-chain fatty acid--CoA ligase [Bacillota bacterium]